MDPNTTSDPQPQQQPSQPQQIQHHHQHQQQPQQQHHHQPPQPSQQQQPHQHPQQHHHQHQQAPTQHHHQQTAQNAHFQPIPYNVSPYMQGGFRGGFAHFPPYPHYPQQYQQWPHQPTSFTPGSQQIPDMVMPQPQSNVPQQHNKSAAPILPPPTTLNAGGRRNVPGPVTVNKAPASRTRQAAVLKDPKTGTIVELEKPAKPSPPVVKPPSNTPATTSKPASVEHIQQTLLQKVSEDNNSDSIDNESSKPQQSPRQQPQNKKSPVLKNASDINDKANHEAASPTKPMANAKATTSPLLKTNASASPTNSTAKPQQSTIVTSTTTPTMAIAKSAAVTTVTATSTTPSVPQEISQHKNDKKPVAATVEATPKTEQSTPEMNLKDQKLAEELSKDTVDNHSKTASDDQKSRIKSDDDGVSQTIEEVVTKNVIQDDSSSSKVTEVVDADHTDESGAKVNGKSASGDSNTDDQKEDSGIILNYEPGQYNPLSNRSGQKKYSRQFLLAVGDKIEKAEFSKKGTDKNGMDGNHYDEGSSEKFDMLAPAWAMRTSHTLNRQNDAARRQNQNNYAGRSSAGQEKQRRIIPSSPSLTQEVELKTSSNPWKPSKEVKEEQPNDETIETEALKKKFRSILNKLTPNNFDNLARAVTDLHIDTESRLGEVIDIIFAKALAEPGYCVLYGQMCSHLKKTTAGSANFGNTLLKRCQNQFQSDTYSGLNVIEREEKIEAEKDPDIKKQLYEELYEDMYRCRMRSLGLIKFIGELYKIEMLNNTIMFSCVLRLLSDPSEESLECLCDLLVTIGEKLDRSSKRSDDKEKKPPHKSAPKTNAYQGGTKSAAAVVASGSAAAAAAAAAQKAAADQSNALTSLDPVFEQLKKIRKNQDLPLSVRIKFKIQDTCELREKDNWHSKKAKDNNPKKIEEIREAHKEKLEQERRQQNAMGPRKSQEGRRLGQSGGSSNQISSMANESSGNRGGSNMHSSSSSHLLRDPSNDNMKSNHNEIENQMQHQSHVKAGLSSIKTLGTNSKSSLSLRPGPMSMWRPTMNLPGTGQPASAGAKTATSATVRDQQG